MNICFIGGGNMATALIAGLLQQGVTADAISVVEISEENRARLNKDYGVTVCSEPGPVVAASNVVVLAVKPQQLLEVARALKGCLTHQLVISIAAGVRACDLSRWLGGYGSLVRVMPNTPAMVRAGVSGLYALPTVDAAQRREAESILSTVGIVQWLADEEQMDAVTAISGSGPAYVFYFIEALEEAAIELGLNAEQARQLALGTFQGAAKLAAGSPDDVITLRTRVTSKGGTTERAIQTMTDAAVKSHIIAAVRAAADRSRELGDELGKAG